MTVWATSLITQATRARPNHEGISAAASTIKLYVSHWIAHNERAVKPSCWKEQIVNVRRRLAAQRQAFKYWTFYIDSIGAPCRTRTCDLLVRSQTLYPLS